MNIGIKKVPRAKGHTHRIPAFLENNEHCLLQCQPQFGRQFFYLKNLFADVTGGKTYDQGQMDWRKRVEALGGGRGREGQHTLAPLVLFTSKVA